MSSTSEALGLRDLRGRMFRTKRQMPEDQAQGFLRKQTLFETAPFWAQHSTKKDEWRQPNVVF